MSDDNDRVHAKFSSIKSNQYSQSKLSSTSPIIASALSNIFPYLLLIDTVLELVTWTNDDHFLNLLLILCYIGIVLYWNVVSYVFLPLLFCVMFIFVIWSVNSIIYDSKHEERPTIDEVLKVLHNITTRIDMILRPLKHVHLSRKDFIRMQISSILLSPVYILLMKYWASPRSLALLVGLFGLTYHSDYSYSIRRLLWRSIYVRLLAFYLTGIDITIVKNRRFPKINHNYKILNKSNLSFDKEGQIVQFDVWEHQRRWLGIGWTNYLLPYERSPFTDEGLVECRHPNKLKFPKIHNNLNYRWKWIDEWKIDQWSYYDNNWLNESNQDSVTKYTRNRKWNRKALLVIDKE